MNQSTNHVDRQTDVCPPPQKVPFRFIHSLDFANPKEIAVRQPPPFNSMTSENEQVTEKTIQEICNRLATHYTLYSTIDGWLEKELSYLKEKTQGPFEGIESRADRLVTVSEARVRLSQIISNMEDYFTFLKVHQIGDFEECFVENKK